MLATINKQRRHTTYAAVWFWRCVIVVSGLAIVTVNPLPGVIDILVEHGARDGYSPFELAIIESVRSMTAWPYFVIVRVVVTIAAVVAMFEATFRMFRLFIHAPDAGRGVAQEAR